MGKMKFPKSKNRKKTEFTKSEKRIKENFKWKIIGPKCNYNVYITEEENNGMNTLKCLMITASHFRNEIKEES